MHRDFFIDVEAAASVHLLIVEEFGERQSTTDMHSHGMAPPSRADAVTRVMSAGSLLLDIPIFILVLITAVIAPWRVFPIFRPFLRSLCVGAVRLARGPLFVCDHVR